MVQDSCARITNYCGLAAAFAFGLFLGFFPGPALAQPLSPSASPYTIIAALIAGTALIVACCAVALLNTRRKLARIRDLAQDDVGALTQRLARSEMLTRFDEQVVLLWEKFDHPPLDLTCDSSTRPKNIPSDIVRLLAFSEWLEPASATELNRCLNSFQKDGKPFVRAIKTVAGKSLEASTRITASGAMMRLRALSDLLEESPKLAEQNTKLSRELDMLRSVLDEVPVPFWIRNAAGQLVWVNRAYAQLVDVQDAQTVIAKGYELLDQGTRRRAAEALHTQDSWQSEILSVVNGKRRNLQIVMRAGSTGEAGCAIDAADQNFTHREVERVTEAHQRTLDHLQTAVAIFGADRKLAYHNLAWENLWQIEPSFLAERPDEGVILDRLRQQRKLPEQADYKSWKAQHLESYTALEPREVWWHLPDGRTLRVFTHPNPQGGITLVQENVTEVLDLKTRAAASERMQRETLDALTDAVAVFGPDGRLKLTNPALLKMWRLEQTFVSNNPHINDVVAKGMTLYDNARIWAELKQSVIAFGEERKALVRQMELGDGAVVDMACVPLPDGATLVTFVDVTDSVKVERVLKERNEALEAATRLKNDFIQHMSYELRSPLTNIIGFMQLLDDPQVGLLNARQREYIGYIGSSSATLLALINDILDLATIDAGVMELDVSSVNIVEAMEGAVEALQDRLSEKSVRIDLRAGRDLGSFTADGRRIRQALYNVLSNAVNFSEEGQSILFGAERRVNDIIFTVRDSGPGIGKKDLPHIFERFETRGRKGGQRGVGLGLSIVKSFVELHGGHIDIASVPGSGTEVKLVFPADMRKSEDRSAA